MSTHSIAIIFLIELGYSKEDILKLDYTNVEYALALDRLSENK